MRNSHQYTMFICADERQERPIWIMPGTRERSRQSLSQHVYNVTSFSLTAKDIRHLVQEAFPAAQIDFAPDHNRQGIVDSWPAALDDTPARDDWGWQPDYDLDRAFQEYLIPNILKRYAPASALA